jgi:metallo-beta-lactamase class B
MGHFRSAFSVMLVLLALNAFVAGEQGRIKISDNLELMPLTESVFIHISYHDLGKTKHFPANGMVYINRDKAFIIDTGWTYRETADLVRWLIEKKKVSILGAVATHWHIDCMGGLGEIQRSGIPSYANDLTREIARQKNLPVPENGFKDELTLKLNEKTLVCFYPGPGHTVDNIVVWLPDEKILFGGCLLKAAEWNFLGFSGDADLAEWPKTLEIVRKKFPQARVVIPGHGRTGTLDLIDHTLELLKKRT